MKRVFKIALSLVFFFPLAPLAIFFTLPFFSLLVLGFVLEPPLEATFMKIIVPVIHELFITHLNTLTASFLNSLNFFSQRFFHQTNLIQGTQHALLL